MLRGASVAALLLVSMAQAWAEEPSGCDKFKWNIDHERAALTASDRAKLESGAELTALPASGLILNLVALADARLPTPPERAPKDGTFAGFARFTTAPKAGVYTISVSAGAWVDVVQGRAFPQTEGIQRRDRLRGHPQDREM